jgi:hypothetical protein
MPTVAAALREAASKVGGMDRQTLRDWVIRFNQQGPDGLINKCSPGARQVDQKAKAFLARLVEEGPNPAIHGVVRFHVREAQLLQSPMNRSCCSIAWKCPNVVRGAGACRRSAKLMAELGWKAVRVRGLTRGGYLEQVRGYSTPADRSVRQV